jgi:hypothetical protein
VVYRQLLEAIGHPVHEEHKAMLEWVGGSFDLGAFDLAAVNRSLAALSVARRRMQCECGICFSESLRSSRPVIMRSEKRLDLGGDRRR